MSETAKTPVNTLSRRVQSQAGRAMLWLRPDGWQARSRQNARLAILADRERRDRGPSDVGLPQAVLPQPAGGTKVGAGA
jgi:hypothetical protein